MAHTNHFEVIDSIKTLEIDSDLPFLASDPIYLRLVSAIETFHASTPLARIEITYAGPPVNAEFDYAFEAQDGRT